MNKIDGEIGVNNIKKKGKVYLVGAGPGDPGLLTINGKEAIKEGDCIIYDHLVNEDLLSFARDDAEKIYVGKEGGIHTLTQGEINRLIVEKAREGKIVVRLKGGDPFIFGRGGEEALEIAEAGIPFEVIPGITSAIAVPAYAGIPLTHRDYNSTVAFVTGQERPEKDRSMIDWKALATGIGTLVFLMGMKNISEIASRLIQNGRDPSTPCAIIRWGTLWRQEVIISRLGDIDSLVAKKKILPPSVIVIGDVVSLREKLKWFEMRPLMGRRILVTRAEHQSEDLIKLLRNHGAEAIAFPTIDIVPPENWEGFDNALNSIKIYDWIIFTSVNGVNSFFQRLNYLKIDIRELKGIKIGAIGPKTAETIEKMGIHVDILPGKYMAEGIIEDIGCQPLQGVRFLLPRSDKSREILPEELRKRGALVDEVIAYRIVIPSRKRDGVLSLLYGHEIDAVTFTSPSTFSNFVEIVGHEKLKEVLDGVKIACIGPVTAKRVMEFGIEPDIMPDRYTIEGLAQAIIDYYTNIK
jgi:uroporphyrinogen III methyltransferase/synthase